MYKCYDIEKTFYKNVQKQVSIEQVFVKTYVESIDRYIEKTVKLQFTYKKSSLYVKSLGAILPYKKNKEFYLNKPFLDFEDETNSIYLTKPAKENFFVYANLSFKYFWTIKFLKNIYFLIRKNYFSLENEKKLEKILPLYKLLKENNLYILYQENFLLHSLVNQQRDFLLKLLNLIIKKNTNTIHKVNCFFKLKKQKIIFLENFNLITARKNSILSLRRKNYEKSRIFFLLYRLLKITK